MARSRSSRLLPLIAMLIPGFLPGSDGRAADGGDNREREVYEALHQADLQAAEVMRELYPLLDENGEPNTGYLEARLEFHEDRKRLGRDEVARRFGLTIDEVEAIRRRGDAEHWPLSDDPRPEPWRDTADRTAAIVLVVSAVLACCGLVYCAFRHPSLLVQAYTTAGTAWRWFARGAR
jgi:hypothetical protein